MKEIYTYYNENSSTREYDFIEINMTGNTSSKKEVISHSGVLLKKFKEEFPKCFEKSIVMGEMRELQISAKDIITNIQSMYEIAQEKAIKFKNKLQIFIHMGTYPGSHKIILEKVARNFASFASDEDGYKANNIKIIENIPLNHQIHSAVPIDIIFNKLYEIFPNRTNDLKVGIEPGQFMCNYTYYLSLSKSYHLGIPSLLIHIPTFEEISIDDQFMFVRSIINILSEYYLKK